MAIHLIDKIKPANGQDYPMVDAEDVLMPDGTRLNEFRPAFPVTEGAAEIAPEKYYTFGEVSALAVTLADPNDGLAHEYCFEFVAAEDFGELSITPAPRWSGEPQIVPGKTHQVSILRGIGVMVCA